LIAPQIHVDHRVPLVSVHLGHRTDRHKSGVVDQDVEPAEVGDDYIDGALELLLVGDIEQIGARTAASAGDLRDDLVELVSPARRDCDDRSLRRQVTGRLGAESGSATGDQHNLAFNCFAHDEPPRTPSSMSRSPPPKITTCPKGIQPQFPNGIVSSVSFVSTTNTARSLAGFVLLALALTPWRSPGSSEKLCPAL
jgi:hypothetical protein